MTEMTRMRLKKPELQKPCLLVIADALSSALDFLGMFPKTLNLEVAKTLKSLKRSLTGPRKARHPNRR